MFKELLVETPTKSFEIRHLIFILIKSISTTGCLLMRIQLILLLVKKISIVSCTERNIGNIK